ncbi:MAG: hypothetical protein WDZ47_07720 [Bacteroidales bacterium]
MNPSSLGIGISSVQRQKDMYKWFGSELFDDGLAEHHKILFLRGNKLPVVKTIVILFYIKKLNKEFIQMNPSSLGIDISAVQRQQDMYKYFFNMLLVDEGSLNTAKKYYCVKQLVT